MGPNNSEKEYDISAILSAVNRVFEFYDSNYVISTLSDKVMKSKKHLVIPAVLSEKSRNNDSNMRNKRNISKNSDFNVVIKIFDKNNMFWQQNFSNEIESYDKLENLCKQNDYIGNNDSEKHQSYPKNVRFPDDVRFYSIPQRLFSDNVVDKDYGFIIYKMVKGKTLYEILREDLSDKNEPWLNSLSRVFVEFLMDLHGNGYAYVDPRLTNFILGEDGVLYILDFEEIKRMSNEYWVEDNFADVLSAFIDYDPGIFTLYKEIMPDRIERLEDIEDYGGFRFVKRGFLWIGKVIASIVDFYSGQSLPLLPQIALKPLDKNQFIEYWLSLIMKGLKKTARRRSYSINEDDWIKISNAVKLFLEKIQPFHQSR